MGSRVADSFAMDLVECVEVFCSLRIVRPASENNSNRVGKRRVGGTKYVVGSDEICGEPPSVAFEDLRRARGSARPELQARL